MNVLDIFSGLGGFSLGLERSGMRTVAFCEIDPYCRAVLKKHWPGVPVYDDVRALTAGRLNADGIGPIDVICGGFPCQDISVAGKGAGLEGQRSGLWSEFRRLIEEVRPAFALIENVSALRSRGLDRVLGEIAALGYDAEWHCIPASAVGAPHRRDRVWIVAYPSISQSGERRDVDLFGRREKEAEQIGVGGEQVIVANAPELLRNGGEHNVRGDSGSATAVAVLELGDRCSDENMADAPRGMLIRAGDAGSQRWPQLANGGWWKSEPTWVEWLMGFPLGWTALEPSETPSSRKSRKSSGARSCNLERGRND